MGSAIIRKLLDCEYTNIITNYHRRLPSSGIPHSSSVTYQLLDLTCQADVERFFNDERPEYVFLAAARVGGILANSTYKAEFIYQNMMIAANVINAAHRYDVKKLLNLGSSCIYPKLALQPLKEEYLLTGPLEPTNEPYAIAKIAAIKLCRYYNEQYGTDFISVMPTNLYGPGDNFDLENSHVLPALIRKLHLARLLEQERIDDIKKDFLRFGNREIIDNGKKITLDRNSSNSDVEFVLNHFGISRVPHGVVNQAISSNASSNVMVTLWGTGTPRREFLFVDDLARAAIHLMQNYSHFEVGEFVNIGSGSDITIKDLADTVQKVIGFDGCIKFDHSKPDGTPQKLLDISRIKTMGWSNLTMMEDGIRTTYEWYVSQSAIPAL